MHFKDLRVHSMCYMYCGVSKQIIAPGWKRGCVEKSANYDFNFWEKNSHFQLFLVTINKRSPYSILKKLKRYNYKHVGTEHF